MFKKIDSVFNEPPEWVDGIVNEYSGEFNAVVNYLAKGIIIPIPFYSDRQLGIVTSKYIHSLIINEGKVVNTWPYTRAYTYRSYLYNDIGIADYCFEMYVEKLRKPIKDWLHTTKDAMTVLLEL